MCLQPFSQETYQQRNVPNHKSKELLNKQPWVLQYYSIQYLKFVHWGKKEARDKSVSFPAIIKKKDQISNNFKLEAEIGKHKLVNGVICHNQYIVEIRLLWDLKISHSELSGFTKTLFQITSLILQYTNYVHVILITLYFSLKHLSIVHNFIFI